MKNSVFLFLVTIFIINCSILNNGVLVADDIYFNFLLNGVKLYKDFPYGTWIMEFQNVLMYYIPTKFNVHILDWATSFGTFFKSLIITIIMWCYIHILELKKIDRKISFPYCILIYFSLFIFFKNLNFINFIIFESFFRFSIVSALILIFLYKLYELITERKNNICLLFIFTFITAHSSEVASAIIITVIVLTILISYLKKEKFTKHLLLILFAAIIGTTFLVSSNGFQEHVNLKLGKESITMENIIYSLKDFLTIYVKKLVKEFIPYYICFFLLALTNIQKKQIKTTVYAITIIIGIWVFAFLLIFMGKTSYSQDYWLEHNDIYVILIPIFIFSITILLADYFSAFTEKNKNILCTILILSIFIIYPSAIQNIATLKNINLNIKKHSYMRDKIRLFYAYKNEKPVMPNFSIFQSVYTLINKKRIIEFGENVPILTTTDFFYDALEHQYYTNIYKIRTFEHPEQIQIVSDKEALDLFIEKGGNCDEIYTGKYHFSNLMNKDFVLNKIDKSNKI